MSPGDAYSQSRRRPNSSASPPAKGPFAAKNQRLNSSRFPLRVRRGYRKRQTVEQQGLCGNAETEHYRWTARRPGWPHLVLCRLGRSERKRGSLLFPDRRSDRQDPHTGDGGQFVLRRPAAKPNVHLRLDVALCSLHECPGRYEAMTSCEASTVT